MRDSSEMGRIVERFFSMRENQVFRSLLESQKKEAFFSVWTRKEGFVKVLGDGLYRSLDKFDVSMLSGKSAKLLRIEGNSREASRWSIQDVKPSPDYTGAFAVKTRRFETRCWRWDVT